MHDFATFYHAFLLEMQLNFMRMDRHFALKSTIMHIYFTRLEVGYPGPLKHPQDFENSWKVYVICRSSEKSSSTTSSDVKGYRGTSDQKDMRTSFIALLEHAQSGQPLERMYDEKKCHEAHTFAHDGKSWKIFRIWGTGVIRIYFMYLPNRHIVILKTKPKRVDKLSAGEKQELENLALDVIITISNFKFQERVV